MTTFWIVALGFACLGFAWHVFEAEVAFFELESRIEKLKQALASTQRDLHTTQNDLRIVQHKLVEMQPKHSFEEYDRPNIPIPEVSAEEKEKRQENLRMLREFQEELRSAAVKRYVETLGS
jgi:hypothetical protein